ncbi:MAG: hypothetical protein SV487_08155, partial [Thermodesulfobacteriota bacterium]|nr:hypothetical protein [Thermodesulfobacteriota bacterium]
MAAGADRLGPDGAPKKESELVDIRKQLGYAGYRSPSAPIMYFGFNLGLALVLGAAYLLLCFV